MKRYAKPTVAILLLLIVLFGLIHWRSVARQPHYQGRSLKEWLAMRLADWDGIHLMRLSSREPEEAVLQMGTNAIPALLSMLASRDYPGTRAVQQFCDQPRFRRSDLPRKLLVKFGFFNPTFNRILAIEGFRILKCDAMSAATELLRMNTVNSQLALNSLDSCKDDYLVLGLWLPAI